MVRIQQGMKMKFVFNLNKKLFNLRPVRFFNCLRKYCNKSSYKILFLGSDNIAFDSLRKVNELRKSNPIIELLDLVTTRGSKNASALEKYALSQNIKLVSWPLHHLKQGDYDLGLIVAFGHMITKDTLDQFPLGMVNVHPSLLPRWRGAAPIIHTLLHGDDVTGVTLMKIKPDIFDVGEIIEQQKVPVSKDIRLPELTQQLSSIGAEMLVRCLKTLPHSLINTKPQPFEGVTYARKISKDISEVRWAEMTAQEIYNLYRAIYGLYPLSTKYNGTTIKLFDAFLYNENEVSENTQNGFGHIEYCRSISAIKVLCKDSKYIYFKSLRVLGKRKITALDFYNGYIKNNPCTMRTVIFQ